MWLIDFLISGYPLKICQILTMEYTGSWKITNPKQRPNTKTKSC